MDYPQIILKPREEGRLQGGHLWAFSNEVAQAPTGIAPGSLADLVHSRAGFIGRGFYHPHSLIAFRILTSQKEDIDESFFEKRLIEAFTWREKCYPNGHAYRAVFGESDRLPGLMVDRYGDHLVVQAVAAGMEQCRNLLVGALRKVFQPRVIIWRADSALRELEGLPQEPPKVVFGEMMGPVQIETENGKFQVDLIGGQKTGFYFDQRDNRQALAPYCRGKRVLDAFCYSGGFGVAAALAGAREIVLVDSAHAALELAQKNAELNNVSDRVTCVEGDAVALLSKQNPGGPFDVIAVDPPAYARSKKHLPAALKAYEKLNALALSALPKGGILASSSCSHHVTRELFLEVLRRAAKRANRNVRLVELRSQARDHPIFLTMPETEYLKFAILQMI
ncbi:MAG: class I SAM-dependent rRNA methyltransferase [Elusimicrobiota bacterium]